MVAGATGIDLFLLVVAADDGVMPQTREHWAVLQALGVRDRRGRGHQVRRRRPAARWSSTRPGAEVVPVERAHRRRASTTLRAALDRAAARVASRAAAAEGRLRLHVDRVFTIRGAGTVVTGTLWSGTRGARRRGDAAARPAGAARVRGVQVHDEPVDAAAAGPARRAQPRRRGPRRGRARRRRRRPGDARPRGRPSASTRGWPGTTEPPPGARVMVHHGTREAAARAVALGGDLWQLRLEAPIVAAGRRPARDALDRAARHAGRREWWWTPAPRRHRHARTSRPLPAAAPDPAPPAEAGPPPLTALPSAGDRGAPAHAAPRRRTPSWPARTWRCCAPTGGRSGRGPAQHFHAEVLADVEAASSRCSRRGAGHARARARRARHLAPLRAGAARALDAERVTLRRGDERVLRRRR